MVPGIQNDLLGRFRHCWPSEEWGVADDRAPCAVFVRIAFRGFPMIAAVIAVVFVAAIAFVVVLVNGRHRPPSAIAVLGGTAC